jgi:hypothetical protein
VRRVALLILLCAVVVPGVAAASSTSSLTSAEYAQLAAARSRLKSANLKTVTEIKAALWACEEIQQVSPLLTEVRADCIAQIEIADFTPAVEITVKSCSGYPAAAKRLSCMLPAYESLYTATSSFYNAETSIHRIASSRSFTAACTNLLSDSPAVIAEEKHMLNTISSLVATMKAGNVLSFEKYSGELITAAAEVQQGQNANSGKLSICAHQ